MSQHHLDTTTMDGKAVHVTAGWDRPLGSYFMRVTETETEETIFDTLGINYDGGLQGMTDVSDVVHYADSLRIPLPERMVKQLYFEGQYGGSNRTYQWTPEGGLTLYELGTEGPIDSADLLTMLDSTELEF